MTRVPRASLRPRRLADRRPRRGRARRSVVAALALGACTGPSLQLVDAAADTVFVDGVETGATTLPFRYYGTTRWDALPADVDGFADFERLPGSATVALPAPVSGWLFPLDFPLELAARLLRGRGDVTARIELPATPPDRIALPEILPETIGAMSARARAARSER